MRTQEQLLETINSRLNTLDCAQKESDNIIVDFYAKEEHPALDHVLTLIIDPVKLEVVFGRSSC